MARRREGRANTARGAPRPLPASDGGAGALQRSQGTLTVRADSGFYGHTVVSACWEMDVRFSITVRQHKSLRDLIEAIPEQDWTPITHSMDGAADVAETTYAPFQTKPDAAPVRLSSPVSAKTQSSSADRLADLGAATLQRREQNPGPRRRRSR